MRQAVKKERVVAKQTQLAYIFPMILLFTLYDKEEARDLSQRERKTLKEMLKRELEVRDDQTQPVCRNC
ncbi:MAG: hypothetical protein WAV07_13810 [Candidatus Contendobacter sp.]